MKKRIISLLCVFALVLGIMPMTVFAAYQPVYLALGNSITVGYGLSSPDTENFAALLAESNNFTFYNEAESGYTSEDLKNLVQGDTISDKIASADFITITIGGNHLMNALYEYLANEYGTSVKEIKTVLTTNTTDTVMISSLVSYLPEFFASMEASKTLQTLTLNLNTIVKVIKDANPDVTILVLNQYNPYSYLVTTIPLIPFIPDMIESLSKNFDTGVQALNETINNVQGITVVDVYQAFEDVMARGLNPCNAFYEGGQ